MIYKKAKAQNIKIVVSITCQIDRTCFYFKQKRRDRGGSGSSKLSLILRGDHLKFSALLKAMFHRFSALGENVFQTLSNS
jgi:hypothetical protein